LGSVGPSSDEDENISRTSPIEDGFLEGFLLDLVDEPHLLVLGRAPSSSEDKTITSAAELWFSFERVARLGDVYGELAGGLVGC